MKTKVEINNMTREQLAACYRENIGYNPFLDDAQITEKEVAQILNEYFDEVQATGPTPLTREEIERQKRDHEEQIHVFREEGAQ